MPNQLRPYAIVTLAEAKEQLGIAGSSEDDLLVSKINRASARVERFLNSRVNPITLSGLVLSGRPSPLLDLGEGLVIGTPASVQVGDTLLTHPTDYQVLNERGQLHRTGAAIGDWAVSHRGGLGGWTDPRTAAGGIPGLNNVVVTATFGYDPVPEDIKEAVILAVGHWRRASQSGSAGLRSERIGDYAYEKFDASAAGDSAVMDLPREATDLLAPYVRHVV